MPFEKNAAERHPNDFSWTFSDLAGYR